MENYTNTYGKRVTYLFIIVTILLAISFLASILIGRYPIESSDLIAIIRGKPVDPMVENVFFTLRLPRTIMVIVAGIGLSTAGSVYQTIFKNPLATPDIIGVSSGANLGAALAITLLAGGSLSIAVFAFFGGIGAVFMALALTNISKAKGIT